MKILFITYLAITIPFTSCNTVQKDTIREYVPNDKEIYKTIVAMDQEFFNAYNNCDLEKQASMYSDNIEFFHDIYL